MLIAHSGGTLPFLAGRIESCIEHDGHLKEEGKVEGRRKVWDVLKKNIYLDAVIYADVGLKAAIEASGSDRLLFGKYLCERGIMQSLIMIQVLITLSSRPLTRKITENG